ncbi:MAG TPA: ribonuclease R, partial [Myxococcota bacterium]|nr:ribonuclease R [Myxococcota bacterium]
MAVDRERVLAEVRGRPRSERELLDRLGGGHHTKRNLKRLLRSMLRAGDLERSDRRYRLPRSDGLVAGTFQPGRGDAGTVVTESGRAFHVDASGGAEGGDRVLLLPLGGPGAKRGEVLEVQDARRRQWIGIVNLDLAGAVVTPYRDDDEWGIPVTRKHLGRARDGDVVVVEPLAKPGRGGRLAGRVVEVLGRPGEPEADFRAVVWHRRLPVEFPKDVLAQVDAIPDVAESDLTGREDLRDRLFVTIDPASARDHDDAVEVEEHDGGFRLWVAIADVSHFVPDASALDREALRRGNSVYFPDRAIPMLPERLSGDLCSLRPDVDRFALVARMDVARDGRVGETRLSRAVIRSRARLHYAQAAAAMSGEAPHPDPAIDAALGRLARCARALGERRMAGGAIDFDLPEAVITLDEHGMPASIDRAARTEAHRAIEEAMLAANRAVAETLLAEDVPAVFRVHEAPPEEDARELRKLLESFGLIEARGRGPLSPRQIADAVARAAGRPEERLVNLTTLRTMQQARYDAECKGHFALAFRAYLHFTSPIRRYADLVVHRAVSAWLDGGDALARVRGRAERLPATATRISWRERVAMSAERDMDTLKKCAFMASRVGQEFDGTVSSVARQGLYLTLDAFFVEGLVHVATLPEWVELDEAAHVLVARDSGRRYGLGDRYRVLVEAVDPVKG